jgi:endonuclease/exonuclease/phosphatase family metal-dependent hydrolase
MPPLVVASFNVHGGVDGWGRPFDVVDACREIGADVLMLQESWSPDGGVSVAERVARELGYAAVELEFARGRMATPQDPGMPRWGPRLWARSSHGMRLDRRRAVATERGAAPCPAHAESGRGTWSIAVMSRLPVTHTETIDLGQLPTDPARRGAIVMDVELERATTPFRVVGTHLAHLSQGSPRQIGALRRSLNSLTPAPGVLAGDMNLWGPPLTLLLPGWARAVRGRTWPTWWSRPLVQSDHVLVRATTNASVRVVAGEVLRIVGSDHFPVRASLVIA